MRTEAQVVLQLASFSAPYPGNFIASLDALARDGSAAGFRQVFAFPESARERPWFGELRRSGTTAHLLPESVSPLALSRRIREIARRERVSLLHTHFTAYDVPAWVAARTLPARIRPKVLWHVHSAFPVAPTWKRKLKDALKMRTMGRSSGALLVSDELHARWVERGFPSERARVLLNGIDIQRACRPSRSRVEIRSAIGLSNEQVAILAFGWDPLTKGVDLLCDAMDSIAYTHNSARLLLVGTERLMLFLASRYPRGIPSWLVPLEPTETVADLYAAADLFISASRWEGCPYGLCEAMAAGKEVICTDIPGTRWALNAGGVRSAAAGLSESLARSIVRAMASSNEERLRAGVSNSEFAALNFGMPRWVSGVLSTYEDLLGSAEAKFSAQAARF